MTKGVKICFNNSLLEVKTLLRNIKWRFPHFHSSTFFCCYLVLLTHALWQKVSWIPGYSTNVCCAAIISWQGCSALYRSKLLLLQLLMCPRHRGSPDCGTALAGWLTPLLRLFFICAKAIHHSVSNASGKPRSRLCFVDDVSAPNVYWYG